MRFIGNKESIVEQIDSFIDSKIISDDKLVLFDAFCGTGSVSDRLKDKFSIVINDNLKGATVYTAGRIYAPNCHFERLVFDPFSFLNQSHDEFHGFITGFPPFNDSHLQKLKNSQNRVMIARKFNILNLIYQ